MFFDIVIYLYNYKHLNIILTMFNYFQNFIFNIVKKKDNNIPV